MKSAVFSFNHKVGNLIFQQMSSEAPLGVDYPVLTHRFLSSRQWDRALATSLEWLAKDPESLRAHRVAGQSLINLDRESEAQKHLERVLAGNPEDDFAHRLMSMVHFEQGRFKAADESIRKALSLDPEDAYHWYQLARMSYNQGDLATGKKCAEKARDLNPVDPNIRNMLILCEPDGSATAETKIRRYEEALELDPESAVIHNNIGVQYLGLKDYKKAEEFFRRALFFNPADKLFRRNLFRALKQRDVVYRVLCAPKDLLFQLLRGFREVRQRSILLYILLIPILVFVFRFVVGGLALWFALVWPMTKVYEYLTIGDIRAQAGEVGARRGGFLGYRKWSLKLRLGLFAGCLVCFWGTLAWFFMKMNSANSPGSEVGGNQVFQAVLGFLIFFGLLIFLGFFLRRLLRRQRQTKAARRRARQVDDILNPGRAKRGWWQFFAKNSEEHGRTNI
jgi:tetratricopeptide (TPR) repeat protein